MSYKFLLVFTIVGIANAWPEVIRMLDGINAKEGEFPYVASLRHAPGFHSCGCSILNERWVLTAAHCVIANKDKPSTFKVKYGVTAISEHGFKVGNVKRVVIHQNYTPEKNHMNDIAVLLLKAPLEFNDKVTSVNLPKQSAKLPVSSEVTLVGWGYETNHGLDQDLLQKEKLITFSNEYCNTFYKQLNYNLQFCAGVPKGVKGECSVDSGSPLIVKGQQVGIVSWTSKRCTIAPYPAVYTNVSHYVGWILEALIINGKYA